MGRGEINQCMRRMKERYRRGGVRQPYQPYQLGSGNSLRVSQLLLDNKTVETTRRSEHVSRQQWLRSGLPLLAGIPFDSSVLAAPKKGWQGRTQAQAALESSDIDDMFTAYKAGRRPDRPLLQHRACVWTARVLELYNAVREQRATGFLNRTYVQDALRRGHGKSSSHLQTLRTAGKLFRELRSAGEACLLLPHLVSSEGGRPEQSSHFVLFVLRLRPGAASLTHFDSMAQNKGCIVGSALGWLVSLFTGLPVESRPLLQTPHQLPGSLSCASFVILYGILSAEGRENAAIRLELSDSIARGFYHKIFDTFQAATSGEQSRPAIKGREIVLLDGA